MPWPAAHWSWRTIVRDLCTFAVPLVLDDTPVGALLAGQVFDQYPEQLRLEHVATCVGLSPQEIWQVARLELPVKEGTLRMYGRLLAALGQAFLHTRYHTLMDAQRLAALVGGEVRLTRGPGHGTIVTVRLPHHGRPGST